MKKTTLLYIIGISLLAGPAIIFAHELGHYISALLLGLHPKLFAMSVITGAIRPRHQAITTASGPLVEFLFSVIGFCLLNKFRNQNRDSAFAARQWLYFVFSMASLRWVFQPILSWTLLKGPTLGLSDEHKLSRILGLPALAVPLVAIAFGWVITALIVRQHLKNDRAKALLITVPAMTAGAYMWALLVGPFTLGQPSPPTPRTLPPRTQQSSVADPVSSSAGLFHTGGTFGTRIQKWNPSVNSASEFS